MRKSKTLLSSEEEGTADNFQELFAPSEVRARADYFREASTPIDQQRSATESPFLTENIRGGAQEITNRRRGSEQGKTIRPGGFLK